METMNHAGFIVASYAAATIVVVALIAWVMLDFRAQRRNAPLLFRLCILLDPEPPCCVQGAGQDVLVRLCQANVSRSHLSPPSWNGQEEFG